MAGSSTQEKGPIKVKTTWKHRMHKQLSRRKRYDMDPPALGEMAPTQMPRPPPEATMMPPAKKVVAAQSLIREDPLHAGRHKALNVDGTASRTHHRRKAEAAGVESWMVHAPKPERVESPPPMQAIRGTLTSSSRAVLSLSRRYAAESIQAEQSGLGGGHGSSVMSKASGSSKKLSSDPTLAWSPTRQSRGLPRPVKEWVCRGLEFTDAGLGIGDRFDTDLKNRAERAPGHIYDQDFGSIGRWRSEASIPTKQICTKYTSTETHKMGARRDMTRKADRQLPGPGTYQLMGFAQELTYKLSKRPKGEAPRSLSPPSSPSSSKMLQVSTS